MNSRKLVFGAGTGALLLVAGLLIALMGMVLSNDTAPVSANIPTPTAKVDLPKTGNLAGVADICVPDCGAAILFHCVAKIDHDPVSNDQKAAAQCFSDTTVLEDPTNCCSEFNDIPGEGTGETPAQGPPPPPPYSTAAPAKGNGSYDPGTDTSVTTTCFSNVGGNAAPNIIATVTVPTAKVQDATGVLNGTVDIWNNQSNLQCDTKVPSGTPNFDNLPIQLRDISVGSAFRTAGDTDLDNDGCTDQEELDKDDRPKGCGDDPWNPGDSGTAADNLSGSYGILATVINADWDKIGDALVPGLYFHCLADLQHNTGTNAVTARLACYIDSPASQVNPQDFAGCTGEGAPGAPPPRVDNASTGANEGCYGDTDDKHTSLTGSLDKVNNVLSISGCFEDRDGQGALGDVFVTAKIDQYTMHGIAQVYPNQTPNAGGNCASGATGGALVATLDLARQNNMLGVQGKAASSNDDRDSDGDGCSDKRELQGDGTGNPQGSGGLRDPFNPWDYHNPTKDGQNRVDDILAAVNNYFNDDNDATPGDAPYDTAGGQYTPQTDRRGLPGSNPWNFWEPNGQHRVDDILAGVNSYFHDCGTGANRIKKP